MEAVTGRGQKEKAQECVMPIRKTSKGWYWGSKGPFKTRAKAAQVARAAYSSGYKGGGHSKKKGKK